MYILQEINLHILLSPITYTTQTLDWGDGDIEMVLYLASQPTLAITGNRVKIALLCEVKRVYDNDPSLLVIVMTLTSPLPQTDIYFVTFDTCYPSLVLIDGWHILIKITAAPLLADTVCHSSHALLLLVYWFNSTKLSQLHMSRLRCYCWFKTNFCQFE